MSFLQGQALSAHCSGGITLPSKQGKDKEKFKQDQGDLCRSPGFCL